MSDQPGRWPLGFRRAHRRLLGSLRRPAVRFVYSPLYQVELSGVDALRGERILATLDGAGLLAARRIQPAPLAAFRELRLVHDDAYLATVDRPETLLPILGLQLPEAAIDRVLTAQRAMVGGTILAARQVVTGGGIAVNLGGGLHHAFADRGERFCLFNDVAVAIARLRADGFAGRVLIVDLDLHDGDGTRAIFAADASVHTFSIHNRTTGPPGVASTLIELGDAIDDDAYLAVLDRELPPVIATVRPQLVVYLAGCDLAADDALGNWHLSAAGILARDRRVLAWSRPREHPLPVVVVLGGGYGQHAWRYSARWLTTLLNGGRVIEPPSTSTITLVRYRKLARELSHESLSSEAGGGDWGLAEEDVAGPLAGVQRPRRFLGFYSRQGLEFALERAGILDRLRALGFVEPMVELDFGNPAGDLLRLWGDPARQELLGELRARVDRQSLPGVALLRIEWLRLQNPRAHFPPGRNPLPGQDHPGLGMLRDVIALLILAVDRLQLDGVLFVPAHFHTALQSRRSLRFVEPESEGEFRALEAALGGLPLAAAAAAVETGGVRDAATGRPYAWRPAAVVIPGSEALRRRFVSADYEQRAAAAAATHRFELVSPLS